MPALSSTSISNWIRNMGSRMIFCNSSDSLLRCCWRFKKKSSEGTFMSIVLGRSRYNIISGMILARASSPSGLDSRMSGMANHFISREWSCILPQKWADRS